VPWLWNSRLGCRGPTEDSDGGQPPLHSIQASHAILSRSCRRQGRGSPSHSKSFLDGFRLDGRRTQTTPNPPLHSIQASHAILSCRRQGRGASPPQLSLHLPAQLEADSDDPELAAHRAASSREGWHLRAGHYRLVARSMPPGNAG